ncbi:hypothetical protein I3760_02G157400 [Carya illinoinensis]|nr:hypothetical protein I3760_02G157400 [Carya illinoinensis]
MVTMLDILSYIAGDDDDQMIGTGDVSDIDVKMAVPVSSITGHCLEGLSLWTLNPNTSLLDCMELFSKGIHRALVPLDSHMENISGVELVESASSYRMLTQMDLLRFLKEHAFDIQGIISLTVRESGAVTANVFAITDRTTVIEAIKCMRAAMLNAVPIVRASTDAPAQDYVMQGRGRKLIGTFSATDLRGRLLATLQSWLPLSALDFTESVSKSPLYASSDSPRELVTCVAESSLAEVIDKAVTRHVHRVWVVDQ